MIKIVDFDMLCEDCKYKNNSKCSHPKYPSEEKSQYISSDMPEMNPFTCPLGEGWCEYCDAAAKENKEYNSGKEVNGENCASFNIFSVTHKYGKDFDMCIPEDWESDNYLGIKTPITDPDLIKIIKEYEKSVQNLNDYDPDDEDD